MSLIFVRNNNENRNWSMLWNILFIRIVTDKKIRDHHMEMFRLQFFWKIRKVPYKFLMRNHLLLLREESLCHPLGILMKSFLCANNSQFSFNVKIRTWGKKCRISRCFSLYIVCTTVIENNQLVLKDLTPWHSRS